MAGDGRRCPAPVAQRRDLPAVTGETGGHRGGLRLSLQAFPDPHSIRAVPGHELPPRARVAEYEIKRTLGQGGFGITYLAWDERLGGPVALKEYFPGSYAARGRNGNVTPASRQSGETFRWGFDRFLQEAQTIHKLSHGNVVHVRRHFEANGTAYLAMEYVEGDSLESILKERRKLTPDEWRPILDALLDGLAHVHSHDYLHRDIKPGNILIRDRNSAPVLIDFGSAREKTPDGQYTAVLTPGYAPLEQSGSGKQTRASDLFSLGAVSYRVLVGELPPSAFDRAAEMEDPIPKLAARVTNADRAWLAALDRCLALKPADRPESVKKVRELFLVRPPKPPAPASSPVAVARYRARFTPAHSGNGVVCTTTLYEGGTRWEVRRWVGRRSTGVLLATVFAPARRGDLSDGQPLLSRVFRSRDDAYAWLHGLDESGEIRKAAEERIESLQPSSPPSPTPRSPSVGRPRTPPAPARDRATDSNLKDRLKEIGGSTARPSSPAATSGPKLRRGEHLESAKPEARERGGWSFVVTVFGGFLLLFWFFAVGGC